MNRIVIPTENALGNFAQALVSTITPPYTIFLEGQLGAGKTTLVRHYLRALGYLGKAKSPSYQLVETYEVGGLSVIHFDLYRLSSAEELEFIGWRDYFTLHAIRFVEWAEKGKGLLPEPDLLIRFEVEGERRVLFLS